MSTSLLRFVAAIVLATSAVSCTTAYDAYGRPIDVVDPAAAVAGAAAVGILAYGLANSDHHHHDYYRPYRGGYYPHHNYYRPSYAYGRGCYY